MDLDFRFSMDIEENGIPDRKYNLNHIENFVACYLDLIDEYLEIDCEEERHCYIFEKSQPVIDAKQNRIKEENYQNISHEHAEVPDCATQ